MARERKFSTEDLFLATRQLLLIHGYEGFTVSLLADRLEVSRGTIYKYFENKEELITEYMISEMNEYLLKLDHMKKYESFEAQFDFLLNLIFSDTEITKLINIGRQIPANISERVAKNKEKLEALHLHMYDCLQSFIDLGRKEKKIKAQIPDPLILGFILHTITIPNHANIPKKQWIESIKEIIKNGMFTNN
ncbi:TetR/AcrR family transcriptional regulator [Neobacillus thermocopriae]|uniref:TetR/AcrR family transcriptional regulator n=1 Tax=Neobacillus thermocopriae TaxID=1215031 RepID=A0A6B3TQE1_9BACI|nr:TetR/AcrR family transcriptional regulator [Neobacillus thermocopriae]MED3622916.1 TetR/AcrR family transcriptional regulator [Neobacillus thermocopriae]MED3713190.1 TetR/AcrR family transcriptional regulator [Neobacillus thermocopriae]NEX79214.1 TetR/AcrR family transcriptional regulator [Neobacillus thermocopriae]